MRAALPMMRTFLFLIGTLLAGAAWSAPPQLLTFAKQAASAGTTPARDVISRGRQAHFNAAAMFALPRGSEVELALPDGSRHPFVFEMQRSHGGGVRSWIGKHRDLGKDYRAIVTSGPAGTFAVFNTPHGEWRLVPGPGGDVLVDMQAERASLPAIDLGRDGIAAPALKAAPAPTVPSQPYMPVYGVNTVATPKATPQPMYDVDLMVVYTAGVAQRLGANLMARLQFLVTQANVVYADSEIAINLRLVGTVQTSYPDSTPDAEALAAISPDCTSCTPTNFDAAHFSGIEAQRTAAGADLVMLLRDTGDFSGSGLAYFGFNPPSPHWMYSVVSGCMVGCDWLFVHELGHNMGLNHDRATAAWEAGGNPNPGGGLFSYSFGYAFCSTGTYTCNPNIAPASGGCSIEPNCSVPADDNFADVMAYFHSSFKSYHISNPDIPCSGPSGITHPCGVPVGNAQEANGALSINNYRAALSAAVPTAAPAGSLAGTIALPAGTIGAPASLGVARIPVKRLLGTSGAIQVGYRTVDGDARAGVDYTAATGTLAWADGDGDDKAISVPLAAAGRGKLFRVELFGLSGPAGASLQSPAAAAVLIAAPWPAGDAFPQGFAPGGFPAKSDWSAAADFTFEGATSVRSPQVIATQEGQLASATLTFQGNFTTGNVAFAYRVSALDATFAGFRFSVDGNDMLLTAGETGWKIFTVPLAAGPHTLVWSMANSHATACSTVPGAPGGSACADRFWIDALSMPAASALQAPAMDFTASPDPSLAGATITLTAALAGPSGTPTGSVAFSDGAAPIAGCTTVSVLSGVATCTTSAMAAGSHSIAAAYSGDAVYVTRRVNISHTVLASPAGSVVNLSTRGTAGSGNDVLIGGFIIGGATAKTVVITATGPSLAQAGIGNPLANPTLSLVRSSDQAVLATNDDWGSAPNAGALQATGLAPGDARESAIMMTLPPGAYTAIVRDANAAAGVAIVAVYEVDHPEAPLANISTRGQVLAGNDVMIAGFVIDGSTPRTVVVTGTGPSLAPSGIGNVLANPTLTLVRSSDQAVIAANDDWVNAPNAAQMQAAGLAPADARESAIMATLPPGAYTAILSGAGASTGIGMVAVYAP